MSKQKLTIRDLEELIDNFEYYCDYLKPKTDILYSDLLRRLKDTYIDFFTGQQISEQEKAGINILNINPTTSTMEIIKKYRNDWEATTKEMLIKNYTKHKHELNNILFELISTKKPGEKESLNHKRIMIRKGDWGEGDISNCFSQLPIKKYYEEKKKKKDKLSNNKKQLVSATVSTDNLSKLEPCYAHSRPVEKDWVGRKKELAQLNEWYQSAKIVGIEAFGGFGKSTLARKWVDNLVKSDDPPDGLFWWCFYHEKFPNTETFLEAALHYFSGGQFQHNKARNSHAKARNLREYLTHGRFVLILDGLEELQNTDDQGEYFGEMLEWVCTDFLRGVATDRHQSFILITTRHPLTDLMPYKDKGFCNYPLDNLSSEDALELMHILGVKSDDKSALDKIASDYDYHALSISLISRYLAKFFKGNITHAPKIPFKALKTDKKVNRILTAYNEKLDVAEKVFMTIFCAFFHQVEEDAFEMVFRQPIPDFDNRALVELSDFDFRRMIKHLINLGLINQDKKHEKIIYSTHPLIRHYYYYEYMGE